MAKKTKTKRFSFQGFDKKHYQTTEQYSAAVDALFNRATSEIANIAVKGIYDPDKPFTFDDYPQTRNQVQSIVKGLAGKMTSVIETGSRKQWLFACQKNDEFVASIMDTSKLSKKRLEKMQDRNLDALKTFQARKVDGMDLSKRVWKYVDQYKDQIEQGLDVGLGDGRSAQQLSKDLRQNLKDPNRLFRRVRDKRGNLQLSKAAKAFHPGQGVYRSSYKNAMRLTRSEINMAYREADWMRWQQLDFVVGFEVHRSNREPRFKCKLCDTLVGRYPKHFKFKGWHPQCMCYATAILMDEETFDEQELSDLKAALKGTEYKKLEAKNAVTDMPQGFKDWVSENQQKQANWGSTPYFIRDNFKGGKMLQGLKFNTSATPTPKIDPVQQQFDALMPQINDVKQLASNWGMQTMALDNFIAKKDINGITRQIKMLKNDIEEQERAYTKYMSDLVALAGEAMKYKIDLSAKLSGVITRREWYSDVVGYENELEKLKNQIDIAKQAITNALTSKDVSAKMPKEFVSGGNYLHGEEYTFDKQFFDLIDPNKPIGLSISTAEKGAYYLPSEKKVYLFDASRNAASSWERKAVVYHEFGHGIDWQRGLRHSKEVTDMRASQIKRLKKLSTYNVWEQKWKNGGGWYYEKVESKMSLVAYTDLKLKALTTKILYMKDETFTKRGITKMDVLEQIGSVRDTIKSLVIRYGDGHSTKYFKQPGKSEAEYLAHAFENAFIGNWVFQKYLPEIYNEMIAYIRSLK